MNVSQLMFTPFSKKPDAFNASLMSAKCTGKSLMFCCIVDATRYLPSGVLRPGEFLISTVCPRRIVATGSEFGLIGALGIGLSNRHRGTKTGTRDFPSSEG